MVLLIKLIVRFLIAVAAMFSAIWSLIKGLFCLCCDCLGPFVLKNIGMNFYPWNSPLTFLKYFSFSTTSDHLWRWPAVNMRRMFKKVVLGDVFVAIHVDVFKNWQIEITKKTHFLPWFWNLKREVPCQPILLRHPACQYKFGSSKWS